jgi:hypothetical protein
MIFLLLLEESLMGGYRKYRLMLALLVQIKMALKEWVVVPIAIIILSILITANRLNQ